MGKLNQKGFTLIEGFLLTLVIAVIGFGGYSVWQNQQGNKGSKSAATSQLKTTSTKKAALYKVWKSHCSPLGMLCLKYPADWKLKTVTASEGQGPNPETNTITSPSGNTVVTYVPEHNIAGTGSNVKMYVVDVTDTKSEGLKTITLITERVTDTTGAPYYVEGFAATPRQASPSSTFTKGSTLSNSYEPVIRRFNPANKSNVFSELSIAVKPDSFRTQQEAQAAIEKSEFQTAIKILESAQYEQ